MKLVEEASTLGFPPGAWPETLYYKCHMWKRWAPITNNGELTAVIYLNNDGKELHVLND